MPDKSLPACFLFVFASLFKGGIQFHFSRLIPLTDGNVLSSHTAWTSETWHPVQGTISRLYLLANAMQCCPRTDEKCSGKGGVEPEEGCDQLRQEVGESQHRPVSSRCPTSQSIAYKRGRKEVYTHRGRPLLR